MRPRLHGQYESVPTTITFDGPLLIDIDQYARRVGIGRSAAVRRMCAYFFAHSGEEATESNGRTNDKSGHVEPAAASE